MTTKQKAPTNPLGFTPLYDKILVLQDEAEKETASGIILPDQAIERFAQGEIIAVGPGYRMGDGTIDPLTVEVGQRVIFSKYGGTTIEVEGREYTIMSEREVHGILE